MTTPIINVENLSKMYRLGTIGTGTLTHDLKRWYYKMRGWEDPYMKIGEVIKRDSKSKNDYVWALKDINFEVKPGEVLGIIGKNGAGKSTLLKILAKVTGPTTGSIHYNGRIGALLEVGTGFHPELTGRENIFLNGAILGMTKAEIMGKIDEIIDFSGVERYIDTPVKRYSSGMMVRLGFAVAAHLEPEILIIDEVLAVGDAEFQKKAIGKMQDISQKDGRTVLFVSHNMASIQTLCSRGLVLSNGSISFEGNAEAAVKHYLSENNYDDLCAEKAFKPIPGKSFQLVYAKVCDVNLNIISNFECDEDVYLFLKFKIEEKIPRLCGFLKLSLKDSDIRVLVSDSNDIVMNFFDNGLVGDVEVKIKIPKRTLGSGIYLVYLNFTSHLNIDSINVDSPLYILSFSLSDNRTIRGNDRGGYLSTLLEWEFIEK